MDGPVAVYVPADGHLPMIARGSGIVGQPYVGDRPLIHGGRMVRIYFEGRIYGQANLVTFADRVYHAADRMAQRYPTVATLVVQETELVKVGLFEHGEVWLDGEHERRQLAGWLDVDEVDEGELLVTHAVR
jgi:hypothetical protein